MSDLIKWFEKRRETMALGIMQRHLSTTMAIVEDLGVAVDAAVKKNWEEMKKRVERITNGEKEADALRRKFMDELSRGELSPTDREDLMHLMKRIDMVADWSRESTRLLNVLPMENVPESLQNACIKMVEGDKECAIALRKCIEKMMDNPQEALKAAEEVEKVINEQNRIETLEQADELENYLTTALEEVRLQKQALQNKADEG